MAVNPLVQIARGMHKVSSQLTDRQLLAAAEMHIGTTIRLPFEAKVKALIVEDDRMVLQYTRYEVSRLARESRYAAAYTVADVFTRDAGVWSRTDRFEAADEAFRPHAVHESGRAHRDEIEQAARRTFEGDCHRPGTSKSPMDSAERTSEGYTTDKMARHWA